MVGTNNIYIGNGIPLRDNTRVSVWTDIINKMQKNHQKTRETSNKNRNFNQSLSHRKQRNNRTPEPRPETIRRKMKQTCSTSRPAPGGNIKNPDKATDIILNQRPGNCSTKSKSLMEEIAQDPIANCRQTQKRNTICRYHKMGRCPYPVMCVSIPLYGHLASPIYCSSIKRACFNWTSLWIVKLEVVPKKVPYDLPVAKMATAEGTFEISLDWKDKSGKLKGMCGVVI